MLSFLMVKEKVDLIPFLDMSNICVFLVSLQPRPHSSI